MRQVLTQPLATIMPILFGLAMLTAVASQAQCNISSVTATATLCSGANSNTFHMSGQVAFTNAPGTGSLIISVEGGRSVVFNAPFTSPISYNIQNLVADGVSHAVTAYFTATPTCTSSTSVSASSPVGTGFYTFPLNSTATSLIWGSSPYPQEGWNNFYVPGYGGPFDVGGGIHDLDLLPQGVTNLAAICGELSEGVGGGSYLNKYQYIALEYLARGRAGEAGIEGSNIPSGGIGKVRAGMLRYLYDQYYTSTDANSWTATNGAALQLAVWEVTHEVYSSNNSFSITSASANGFYVLATYNTTSRDLAQTYLNAINTLNWTDAQWMSYQSTNWHLTALESNDNTSVGGADSQDLIIAQPLICTVANVCDCPGNLLTNPGFETSDFTGWTLSTNDPGQTSFAGDNTYAACGNRYAYFNPTAGNSTDYVSYHQNVAVTAGSVVNLSVYSGVHDPSKNHEIRLQFFDASNTLLSGGQIVQIDHDVDLGAMDLLLYNLSGTAPANTAYVRVTAYVEGAYTSESISLKVDAFCMTITAAVCSLANAGETLENCNNNGTISITTDDYITFSLNPTGTGLGATYSVTASSGTVTLAAGGAATGIAYGSATAFRLQVGSANGTSITITVTDASGAPCTVTTTVQQNPCSNCIVPTHNTPTTIVGTCTGSTANNNASITIPGITNADRIGISTAGAVSYNGPAYGAPATSIAGGSHTFSNLVHNSQYRIRIFNGSNECYTDVIVTTANITCTCNVSIVSATPTVCNPATNSYNVSVVVSWTNAFTTTLTVSSDAPGATNQTINTTVGSSGSQTVTFTGLTANGVTNYDVTVQFNGSCTATNTNAFNAPTACTACPTGNCGGTAVQKVNN